MTSDPPAAEAPAPPALLLVTGPSEADTALLVVALAAALRARGVRVGTAEARPGLEGAPAIVLTTGSGARIPLPGAPGADALRARARAIDPALELLLVMGVDTPDLPRVVVTPDGGTSPVPGVLAAIHPAEVRRALEDPEHALAAIEVVEAIEAALLGGTRTSSAIDRASAAPIESERRLLDRPDVPAPRPGRGWRRWLGR